MATESLTPEEKESTSSTPPSRETCGLAEGNRLFILWAALLASGLALESCEVETARAEIRNLVNSQK